MVSINVVVRDFSSGISCSVWEVCALWTAGLTYSNGSLYKFFWVLWGVLFIYLLLIQRPYQTTCDGHNIWLKSDLFARTATHLHQRGTTCSLRTISGPRNWDTFESLNFRGGRKSIILLEGSQATPARPSGRNNVAIYWELVYFFVPKDLKMYYYLVCYFTYKCHTCRL
jgi:hypothetical protein